MLDLDIFYERSNKISKNCLKEDEVPIGAVVVQGDKIIGKGIIK